MWGGIQPQGRCGTEERQGSGRAGSSGARGWSCTNGESRRGTDSAQYRPNWTVIISGGGGGGWPPLASRPKAGWPARRARCCSPARHAVLYFSFVTRAHSVPWKVPRTTRQSLVLVAAARVSKWTVCVPLGTHGELGTTVTTKNHLIHSPLVWSRPPRLGLGQASREPLPTLGTHV